MNQGKSDSPRQRAFEEGCGEEAKEFEEITIDSSSKCKHKHGQGRYQIGQMRDFGLVLRFSDLNSNMHDCGLTYFLRFVQITQRRRVMKRKPGGQPV